MTPTHPLRTRASAVRRGLALLAGACFALPSAAQDLVILGADPLAAENAPLDVEVVVKGGRVVVGG